jgi:hypothetical protein
MEDAYAIFSALGFYLTPRGYQSLGSINHLAMFGTDYLEIVGLPSDGSGSRPDLDNASVGINGLVFKSDDAEATYAYLQAVGLEGPTPIEASRPVEINGQVKTASFRNVNVRSGVFEGGRVYFCEHRTPELVWRPEYQHHQNGVTEVEQFTIVSSEPAAVASNYAKLLDREVVSSGDDLLVKMDGMELLIQSPTAYGVRYGNLVSPVKNRSTMFGALRFRTPDLSLLRSRLHMIEQPLLVTLEENRIIVRLPEFDTLLEFIT